MNGFDDIFAVQSPSKSVNRDSSAFDKEAWAAQKQQERENSYALIDKTAGQMAGNGGLFKTYLDVQSRFDRYSVGNAILITAQMPIATRLADFKTWKEGGMYIKKGAAGVTILEPGEEYTRDDGSVKVPYNAKKVFDISQTNSRQTPTPSVTHDERLLIKALINNAPCRITISSDLPDNVGAVYKPEDRAILVRQGMNAADIYRSISQELAHAHMDKGEYNRSDCAFTAYCVSYILCKRNGVDIGSFSFDHLPSELSSMETQGIRNELSKIRDVANEISSDMARVLEPQQRSSISREAGAR